LPARSLSLNKIWLEPQEVSVPSELADMVGGHPLVAQTLARRGITTRATASAFLDPGHYLSIPPTELPGLAAAASRLADAVQQYEPICVWGDFDVDGQTATTVLVSTLRALGAEVSFHIPVRERESHGVNLPVLREIIERGAKVVLTCDTGITAHEAVDYARQKGVEFIITDHHDLPPTLPKALAIVNPKLLPGNHPLGTLPGVGVAYKLAEELCNLIRPLSFQASSLVDLATLGIVADIAVQTGEARYLVQRGLEMLRKTDRPGLKALMESAELNPAWITEEHIGFVIAPRLNALGRLADANLSVEFLTTQDLSRARVIATILEGLNARRQLLTSQVFQAAQAQIEREPALLDDPALVLWQPSWPAGVIGIVASRLAAHYRRPVVLLASPPGELARGSARSIAGINITATIAEQRELLASFGGHPMAAGLSIDAEHLPEFRRGLIHTIRRMTGGVLPEATLQVDGYLTLPELSLNLAEDLQRLAPFGPGNPALVLAARNLSLAKSTPIGRGDEHLQLIIEDENGNARKVLWWQGGGLPLPKGRFDLAFTLRASDYRGARDIQMEWVDARLLEAEITVEEPARRIEVIDYRQEGHPLVILQQLTAGREVQVWCEGEAVQKLSAVGIPGRVRHELAACPTLAIWTTPPGPVELQAALERVVPEVVYVFAVDPETADQHAFLKRLAGLVIYALNHRGGQADLAILAAATAQSEITVWKGLGWLAAHGDIAIISEENGRLKFSPGNKAKANEIEQVTEALKALLAETAAYRTYFHIARKENLTYFSSGNE
jgi:single-stranded-DNA-specific exonuclease